MITLPSGRCAMRVRTLFLFTLAAIAGRSLAIPESSGMPTTAPPTDAAASTRAG